MFYVVLEFYAWESVWCSAMECVVGYFLECSSVEGRAVVKEKAARTDRHSKRANLTLGWNADGR